MSSQCKIVKGISVLVLLFGLASVITGAIMFFATPSADLGIENVEAVAKAGGILLIIVGAFGVLTGVLGIRGANNPQRMTPFIVCAALIAIVNIFEVIMALTGGQGPVWMNILYAIVAIVAIVFAVKAKKQA